VLHQEGLDPVVVSLLANPIRGGGGLLLDLKPLAEGLGEILQLGLGKAEDGGVNSADRGSIAISHCSVGVLAYEWVAAGTVTVASR
jgi:hypothetical protein